MKKESIGIVGGGIVGSTAAYYLTRQGYDVTLFDEGTGQATRASAGIICPWFTLRRNKPWYFLVSQGAEFYRKFISDLKTDGHPVEAIFELDGALLLRKKFDHAQRDVERAVEKRLASPSIGDVTALDKDQINDVFPLLDSPIGGSYVEGGAQIDGAAFIDILHKVIVEQGGHLINERAQLHPGNQLSSPSHESRHFDKILLATGAWLPQILEPLGYQVGIRPQKGQLFSIQNDEWKDKHWPVVMPPGTGDIIPFNWGEIVIGATHEDDMGYDLAVDQEKLGELAQEAKQWFPTLDQYEQKRVKVGIRAYTKDYTVLVGRLPQLKSEDEANHIWAISGLGSSGLTSGPYLGYQWSQLVQTGEWDINEDDYPIGDHIQ